MSDGELGYLLVFSITAISFWLILSSINRM
jgi:hypothetical protein